LGTGAFAGNFSPITPSATIVPSTVAPGSFATVNASLSYANPSSSLPGDGADFTFSVPVTLGVPDLTFDSFTGADWNCTVPNPASPGIVRCTKLTSFPGSGPSTSNFTVRYRVRSNPISGNPATETSQITYGATLASPPASVTNQVASFAIDYRVDFSPTLSLQPVGDIVQGTLRTLRTRVENLPSGLNNNWANVRVDYVLPANVQFDSVLTPGWNCGGGANLACVRSSQTPPSAGRFENLDLSLRAVAVGSSNISASVSSGTPDLNPGNNSAQQAIVVIPQQADLSVVSAVQTPGSPVVNGSTFSYAVTVSNLGPQSSDAVRLRAEPSPGINLTAPSGCSKIGNDVQCDLGTLTSGQSLNFSFSARHELSAPSGALQTRFVIQSPVTTDPASGNNERIVTTFITPAADQSLSQLNTSLGGSVAPANSEFTVTAVVNNLGPDSALDSRVTFALQGLTYVGPGSGGAYVCPSSGAQTIQCTASGSLAVGASATANIRVRSPVSGTASVSATASATTFDPVTGNNARSVDLSVVEQSALQLQKRADLAQVAPGGLFRYTLLLQNPGTSTANGLVLLDFLPIGASFVRLTSAGPFSCTNVDRLLDCRLSALAAGGTANVEFEVRAPNQVGSIVNTAEVSTSGNAAPVRATVTTQVVASSVDLALSKTDLADPVAPGAPLSYQLLVTNVGVGSAENVRVLDNLPAGALATGFSGPGWSCTGIGTASVSCTLQGALAAGQSSALILATRAPNQVGLIVNRAEVSTSSGDSNSANNVDDEDTRVADQVVDVALGVSPADGSVLRGQDFLAVFTARNLGTGVASGSSICVSVDPTRGENLRVAGANCVSAGASSFRCELGSLPALGTASVQATARPTQGVPDGGVITLDGVLGNGGICGSADANPGNDRAQSRFTVVQPQAVDLAVTLTDSADPVELETEFDLRAEVRNLGLMDAPSVRAEFTLGTGLSFVRATGAGWSCSGAAPQIICTLAMLARGGTSALTLTVDPKGQLGAVDSVVRVSSTATDSQPANNQATQRTTIGSPDRAEEIQQIVGPGAALDRFASDAAPIIANICANPSPDLASQCNAIINSALAGNSADVVAGLRALYPQEVISQAIMLNQAAATQFSNVDARLSEVRGGGGGFSVSGLNVGLGSQILPLGMVRAMFGEDDEEATIGGSGELISRWGGFVNGTIARGGQSTGASNRRIVTDYQSLGLTAGVDYRVSTRWVLGGALGFADFESDLEDGGGLQTNGFTLTGYTSFYPLDRLYVDARLSYSSMSLDLKRRIFFRTPTFTLDRTALGETDSTQLAFATTVGYHLAQGAWNVTPNLGLRYVDSTIDGFAETGAQDNNASFAEQNFDSLQLALGVQVSRVISLSNGVITPQFDLSLNRESKGDARAIDARLAGARAATPFAVVTDDEDSSFGNAGIGFVYVGPNGRQAYISYRRLFGSDTLTRDSINLGARFEF